MMDLTKVMDLVEELATIQAHLDNDMHVRLPIWRKHRDRVVRELADTWNREMADG